MICPANWIVLWETVACYLPPKSPFHLFSCPWSSQNLHEKTSHFKTPTLALPKSRKKNLQILLFQPPDIRTNHHHVSGFPDGRRLQGRIQHLKGRIVTYTVCLGRGSHWRRRLGWKKTPSWTNHRCTVGCWDSMISLYIYIYTYVYLLYIPHDLKRFSGWLRGILPLFHQNFCQISSFFPARIPRFPAKFPRETRPPWRTWRQSPTDGEMSFLTLGDVGIKASRTQNGGFFCL